MRNNRPGRIENCILNILKDNSERYGLEIQNEINLSNGYLTLSAIHYSIRKLEKSGYIKVSRLEHCAQNRGGRPRTYFQITPKGGKAVKTQEEQVSGWVQLVPAMNFSN